MRCFCFGIIFLGMLAGTVAGAGAPSPASQPAVRATTIDGQSVQGRWLGMSPQGAIRLLPENGQETAIAADQAMGVRFREAPSTQPASNGGYIFYLADGSRFAGKLTGGSARELVVTVRGAPLKVPLDALAAIRFSHPPAGDALDVFNRMFAQRDASEDLLITVRQGRTTSIKGVTEQITPEGGSFRWRDRSIPLRSDSAFAIIFARGVQAAPTAKVWCSLDDGSIWGGDSLTGGPDQIVIHTSLGANLTFEPSEVSELRFQSERVQFISELKPVEYVFEPFAVTKWPYGVDRSLANTPLRIGGKVFERGLAMHSQSRLVYELPAGFSQLAATIGIDDAVRPRGSVVFRVLADGKEVFNSGPVRGEDAPRPIRMALASPKKIELCVDFGDGLDLSDHADWGHIRLIK